MAATQSTDQFLDVLRKSKLVDEKRLEAFLQSSSPTQPVKPRELAQQLIRHGLLTPWQATQLLAGKSRGFLVAGGKYKLMDLLGVGGMGKVFLCEHLRMKRLVALKVLPTDKLEEDSSLERFDREARATAALDHPNIVRAHDIDTDNQLHFLVMEYVDGTSLHDIVKKFGPMDITRACHYVAQAAEGLQHAHEAGWVHRDIKPGNLLLDRSGTIKILDMGLARFFHDDGTNPLTKKYEKNAVLGTADYLAPEQAVNSSDVDIRADIYSLGATFYFLLTGRGPFDQGTVAEKLIWHQMRQPDSIHGLRPEVPKELEAVIAKMMAKKPVHRYQEPAAVVEALRPWTEKSIEKPADEEMPRLSPILEAYATVGQSLPASGITSNLSAVRPRSRGGPRTSTSRMSHPRLGLPLWRQKQTLIIGGGAAAGLLLLIGVCYWAFHTPDKKTEPNAGGAGVVQRPPRATTPTTPEPAKGLPIPPAPATLMELPPASPNRLYVTRSPKFSVDGRKDVAPTLAEAITKAKSVQTLVVLDETIEEQVVVDGRHNGLRIESGLPGGQSVTWRPPANAAADQPLLRLEGAGTALVKGFSLEGDQRVNTLVRVSGPSAGLRLEDLYFTDARQQSLVLADCAAPVEQPLTVEHVRFTTLHDYSIASHHNAAAIRPAAVECTAESASGTAAPLHLAIRSCRFEGMFRAAVLIECPVEGEIRLNRFYSLRNDERPSEAQSVDSIGVKVPAAGPVRLMIASNTSSRFTTLLHLDRLPPADGVNQIALRSNLVIGTQGDAWVVVDSKPDEAAAKAVFAASDGNVCRPGTVLKGLGAAIIPRKPVAPTEYFNISLADDRTFLRYSKTGKWKVLADAGANGEPAGVPPLD